VIVNLVVDILHAYVDPRVKQQYMKSAVRKKVRLTDGSNKVVQ